MNDAIDLPVSERFVETVSITDVGVYQRGTAGIEESGDVAAFYSGIVEGIERIDDDNFIAAGHQPLSYVASYEPGPTGNENPHGLHRAREMSTRKLRSDVLARHFHNCPASTK